MNFWYFRIKTSLVLDPFVACKKKIVSDSNFRFDRPGNMICKLWFFLPLILFWFLDFKLTCDKGMHLSRSDAALNHWIRFFNSKATLLKKSIQKWFYHKQIRKSAIIVLFFLLIMLDSIHSYVGKNICIHIYWFVSMIQCRSNRTQWCNQIFTCYSSI